MIKVKIVVHEKKLVVLDKMDALKKLEETQTVLTFMESQGFIPHASTSSHLDSHRFLAHFLIFLFEPYGNLSIENKCSLISQYLPKISPSFVKNLLVVLPEKQMGNVGESLSVKDDAIGSHELGSNASCEDLALIGLDAMQRANSTLEDFCRSYFMFHEMDVKQPETLFKYLPVLSFTESFIYQLDTLNEKMVNVTIEKPAACVGRSDEDACSNMSWKFDKVFQSDPFRPLTLLLQHHGLLTERIAEELKNGEEYWALERRLCGVPKHVKISTEDVLRAIHLKSFDYRVLNLLLYQLRGEQVNDLHMEFLTVSELLVEISDDLFDYEEDVLENNFNVLRMFVRIYGASMAPTTLAKYIAEAEETYEKLSKALDPQLSSSYLRRCEEATREGGKVSGYSLGSWTIPPIIIDEELYRSSMPSSPKFSLLWCNSLTS